MSLNPAIGNLGSDQAHAEACQPMLSVHFQAEISAPFVTAPFVTA